MSRNCPTPESAGRSTTMMEIPIQKGIFSKEFIYSSQIEIFFRHYLARRRSYTIHASIFNFSFDVFL